MNYIEKYGNRKREPRKFQGGGDMPGAAAPEGAPAGPPPGAGAPPAGGEIESMLREFVTTQDPQLAVQICTMMAAQMGIEAPAPAAPEGGGAPTEMPGGAGMPGAPTGAGAGGMPMGKRGMSIPVRTQMRTFAKPTVIKPKL